MIAVTENHTPTPKTINAMMATTPPIAHLRCTRLK